MSAVMPTATAVEMQQQVPMQVTIPAGVAEGGNFMVGGPDGSSVMVTAPPGTKSGDTIQVMMPAPAVPVASASVVSAVPAMTTTPSLPMMPPGMSFPGVRGVDGRPPPSQEATLDLPAPIFKRSGPANRASTSVAADAIQSGYGTSSPEFKHYFTAPLASGAMAEAEFDRATVVAGVDTSDPLASLLSGGTELTLDLDVAGRMKEIDANMQKNLMCYVAQGATVAGLLCLCKPLMASPCMDPNNVKKEIEARATAHKLTLTSDALIFERTAHFALSIKNFTSFDQYGHRYPVAGQTKTEVPAMKVSLPIGRVSVEVAPRRQVVTLPPMVDAQVAECCHYDVPGDVVVVKAGSGLKVVVCCIECGPNSNAHAFAQAVNSAASRAPAESAQVAAAFHEWFLRRVQVSGTMAGSKTPTAASMARDGYNPSVEPFVKTVGPLGPLAMSQNRWGKANHSSGLMARIHPSGVIDHPGNSPVIQQLNCGDRIVAINGNPVPNNRKLNYACLTEMDAKPPPSGVRTIDVISTMPYFQPNQVVTVTCPAGGLGGLGLDSASPARPPAIAQPGPTGASLGLFASDAIISALVDGQMVDATKLTAGELLGQVGASASPISLTVLQRSRVADLNPHQSWPTMSQGLV